MGSRGVAQRDDSAMTVFRATACVMGSTMGM